MSAVHYIKITKNNFEAVLDGTKRAEIRNNDRGYQKGDTLYLEEVDVDPKTGQLQHTGRVHKAMASYVTNYMQKEGVVVISMIPLPPDEGMVQDANGGTEAAGSGKPANDAKRRVANKSRNRKRRK